MPDFRLPDLGEGLTDAEIVDWRVAVGDSVEIDQTVVEVETAKAVVEVPVPFAGIVSELHGAPGERIAVGSPLISVSVVPSDAAAVTASERGRDGSDGPPRQGFAEPGVVVADTPASQGSGNVLIGYGTSDSPRRRRRGLRNGTPAHSAPTAPADEPATAQATALTDVPASPQATAAGETPTHPRVISPLVRRLAREAGVEVGALNGSGIEGIVLRRDVEEAIREADSQTRSAAGTPGAEQEGQPGERRIPLRGIRKLTADKLARSRREIPEATVWVDVDATALLQARAALNKAQPDAPVSLLALFARFAVLGLRRYPELNGRIEADELVLPSSVNLGFAAQTNRGLMVPVIHGAERLTTAELSARLAETTAAARSGTLAPAALSNGTFTVNNYGGFGVDGSAAIINHPEVAILGLGRIIDRPWVVDGQIVVRSVTELTLAFDHRACDGGVAGGFLRFVADCVESPVTALRDL